MIQIYDTTLRDGTQREGMSLSVDDKLRILAARRCSRNQCDSGSGDGLLHRVAHHTLDLFAVGFHNDFNLTGPAADIDSGVDDAAALAGEHGDARGRRPLATEEHDRTMVGRGLAIAVGMVAEEVYSAAAPPPCRTPRRPRDRLARR